MKYIIISIFIFGSLQLAYTQTEPSEPCGQPINCEKKERPYGFCNGEGHIAYLCAEDPFSFDGGMEYEGFDKVLKLSDDAIPLCLEFDNTGPDEVIATVCGNGECHKNTTVYYKSDFIDDMNAAVEKWKCPCGWGEDDCGCTINIGFVDENDNEFKDPKNDHATTSLENQLTDCDYNWMPAHKIGESGPLNYANCEISCNQMNIYLNNTQEYTQPREDNPNYYEGGFYASKSVIDNWPSEWVEKGISPGTNLRNVIAKKLGRLYGLIVEPDYGENCREPGGIMQHTYGNLEYRDLNSDDKCAIMTLYCPELVPVTERLIQNSIELEVIPNPSVGAAKLRILSDKNYNDASLFIFNNNGKTLSSLKLKSLKIGENIITVNNKGLTNGTYYYIIDLGERQIYSKFIINK